MKNAVGAASGVAVKKSVIKKFNVFLRNKGEKAQVMTAQLSFPKKVFVIFVGAAHLHRDVLSLIFKAHGGYYKLN